MSSNVKSLLFPFIVICLAFSSCDHHPTNESQQNAATVDTVVTTDSRPRTLILKEPIVNSVKHYFSDTLHMDSFVMELPAGNIFDNDVLVKIYSSQNELLFNDSFPASTYFYDGPAASDDESISIVRKGVMAMFNVDNFNYAGQEEAIKNASAAQITNMIGFNEAVGDTDRVVFNYNDGYRGTSYVAYSAKLKKAAMIVQIGNEGD